MCLENLKESSKLLCAGHTIPHTVAVGNVVDGMVSRNISEAFLGTALDFQLLHNFH